MAAETIQNIRSESERKKRHRERPEALGRAVKKCALPGRDHFGHSHSAPGTPDCWAQIQEAPSIAAFAKTFALPDINSCDSPSSGSPTSDNGAVPSVGPPIWQVGEDHGGYFFRTSVHYFFVY